MSVRKEVEQRKMMMRSQLKIGESPRGEEKWSESGNLVREGVNQGHSVEMRLIVSRVSHRGDRYRTTGVYCP